MFVVVYVFLLLLSGCSSGFDSSISEATSTPESIATLNPTVMPEEVATSQCTCLEDLELKFSIVVDHISINYYPHTVTYLDLGENLEVCEKLRGGIKPSVKFTMMPLLYYLDEVNKVFEYEIELSASQYRALYDTISDGGYYTLEVIIKNGEVISIGDLTSSEGKIWNIDSRIEEPRELNGIEEAFIQKASELKGTNPENFIEVFTDEICRETSFTNMSYLEASGRSMAATHRFSNLGDQNFLILDSFTGMAENCFYDPIVGRKSYRLVGENGRSLTPIYCSYYDDPLDIDSHLLDHSVSIYPSSSDFITLQEKRYGDDKWEKVLELNTRDFSNLVIQAGYYKNPLYFLSQGGTIFNGLFTIAGQEDNELLFNILVSNGLRESMHMAELTDWWPEEKVIENLKLYTTQDLRLDSDYLPYAQDWEWWNK